jgi:hypothetical protein
MLLEKPGGSEECKNCVGGAMKPLLTLCLVQQASERYPRRNIYGRRRYKKHFFHNWVTTLYE